MRNVTFSERQRFNLVWIWAMLFGVNVLTIYGFIQQVVLGNQFGNNPSSDIALTLVALFTLLISLSILAIRLDTYVDNSGISYRFVPFHLKTKKIHWDEVDRAYVRKYNPIRDYGGWGIRLGAFGKGNAYNMSGNMGLQLVLKNGKKVLFGTQLPKDLDRVIKQLGVKTTDQADLLDHNM